MDKGEIQFVEVFVEDVPVEDDDLEPTETYWVTESIYLRVPTDFDTRLLIALIDTICAC